MLTRTATVVRKNRRRSGSKGSTRRGSAPTVLQPSNAPPSPRRCITTSTRTYLTPQPSPSRSVTFSFESDGKLSTSPDLLSIRRKSSHVSSFCEKAPYYGSFVLWNDPTEVENSVTVYAGLREACDEAEGICDFLYRAFFVISATWPVTIILGILLAMPITMIIIGVKYLDECPREPKIPVYLLVGGCFGGVKLILTLCDQARKMKDDVDEDPDDSELMTMSKMAHIGLNLFLSVWFVFGNYWLYGVWTPKFTAPLHEPRNWCDRTVFTFTWWQIIICYVIIAFSSILAVILCVCFTSKHCKRDAEKG